MRRGWFLAACLLAGANLGAQTLAVDVARPGQAATAAAASPSNAPVFRGGVDLVALNVVVTDGRQKFVSGLNQGNFNVFEDGVRQDVSFFATSAMPLDLAMLLDTSASMTDKMKTMREAATGFARSLRAGDRLTVVDIKDSVTVLHPLDSDMDGARQAIESTTARGGTALYNAVYLTLKDLVRGRRDSSEPRRQAIVLFTDGDDTASLVSFDDLLDLAKEAGVAIYTIALRSSFDQRNADAAASRYYASSEFALKALAQETGARSFFPAEIGELAGVYGVIAEELASEYAIGYMPRNAKRDGSYRHVSVQVTSTAGAVRTRTRAGYTAPRGTVALR
jgi:VWFA-related protein